MDGGAPSNACVQDINHHYLNATLRTSHVTNKHVNGSNLHEGTP